MFTAVEEKISETSFDVSYQKISEYKSIWYFMKK